MPAHPTGSPWAFHLHGLAWLVVIGTGVGLVALYRHVAGRHGDPPGLGRRHRAQLAVALVALAVALTWPVADLAAHWSLTALLVQRLLLTMVVAPLLLLAAPPRLLAALTSPAPVDDALATVTRPVVAIVIFAAIVLGSLLPVAVAAQASSWAVRGAVDALLVVAGVVLWGPVLRHIPGTSRPAAVGVAAYLIVQSVLPGFPSVLYIFARHPFYPAFAGAHRAIGLSPLDDQQLAGVIGKVGTLPVLWTVAWIVLARAQRAEAAGADAEPWHWLDVERRLQRAERRQARAPRRPGRNRLPRPGGRALPVVYPPGWTEPAQPAEPDEPAQSARPAQPTEGAQPGRPAGPAEPSGPAGSEGTRPAGDVEGRRDRGTPPDDPAPREDRRREDRRRPDG